MLKKIIFTWYVLLNSASHAQLHTVPLVAKYGNCSTLVAGNASVVILKPISKSTMNKSNQSVLEKQSVIIDDKLLTACMIGNCFQKMIAINSSKIFMRQADWIENNLVALCKYIYLKDPQSFFGRLPSAVFNEILNYLPNRLLLSLNNAIEIVCMDKACVHLCSDFGDCTLTVKCLGDSIVTLDGACAMLQANLYGRSELNACNMTTDECVVNAYDHSNACVRYTAGALLNAHGEGTTIQYASSVSPKSRKCNYGTIRNITGNENF